MGDTQQSINTGPTPLDSSFSSSSSSSSQKQHRIPLTKDLPPFTHQITPGRNAPIKKEYLVPIERNEKTDKREGDSDSDSDMDDNAEEKDAKEKVGGKRQREDKESKKSKKNKGRLQRSNGLCLAIIQGRECSYGANCKYSHDVEEYLKTKPEDIAPKCYIFDTHGRCPYGFCCRFGSTHMNGLENIVDEKKVAEVGESLKELNILTKDIQQTLRKKRDYPRSTFILNQLSNQRNVVNATSNNDNNNNNATTSTTQSSIATDNNNNTGNDNNSSSSSSSTIRFYTPPKPSGKGYFPPPIEEEKEISDVLTPLTKREKTKINWKGKLYLAPLTTVGNLPFRRICKSFGADITCGEMALAQNIIDGHGPEWALLRRHPSEDLFGIQICGARLEAMVRCGELLSDEDISFDFLDINSGCPIDLICNTGAGAAMLEKPKRMESIVRGVSTVCEKPVTIKLRIGTSEKEPTAHEVIRHLKVWGAKAVTLHGRSRRQRYSKTANWDYIKNCAALSNIPLIGNGDIYNWQDATAALEKDSKVETVMIARAALIKPWIFTEIKEQRDWDISATERLDMVKEFANFGLEHWGSDDKGVETTREFLLNWLSFTYRYVPVGILETLPSKLNDRPPRYFGRNELETRLSSPNVLDWIKISEMFLGPVPSGFNFTPKHKSNSYEAQG